MLVKLLKHRNVLFPDDLMIQLQSMVDSHIRVSLDRPQTPRTLPSVESRISHWFTHLVNYFPLVKISYLTNIFEMGWLKPPTSIYIYLHSTLIPLPFPLSALELFQSHRLGQVNSMTSGVTKQCLVSAVVLMRGKKSVASPFFGYTRFRETPADVFFCLFF